MNKKKERKKKNYQFSYDFMGGRYEMGCIDKLTLVNVKISGFKAIETLCQRIWSALSFTTFYNQSGQKYVNIYTEISYITISVDWIIMEITDPNETVTNQCVPLFLLLGIQFCVAVQAAVYFEMVNRINALNSS